MREDEDTGAEDDWIVVKLEDRTLTEDGTTSDEELSVGTGLLLRIIEVVMGMELARLLDSPAAELVAGC